MLNKRMTEKGPTTEKGPCLNACSLFKQTIGSMT